VRLDLNVPRSPGLRARFLPFPLPPDDPTRPRAPRGYTVLSLGSYCGRECDDEDENEDDDDTLNYPSGLPLRLCDKSQAGILPFTRRQKRGPSGDHTNPPPTRSQLGPAHTGSSGLRSRRMESAEEKGGDEGKGRAARQSDRVSCTARECV
jgi:hypothetical protein